MCSPYCSTCARSWTYDIVAGGNLHDGSSRQQLKGPMLALIAQLNASMHAALLAAQFAKN